MRSSSKISLESSRGNKQVTQLIPVLIFVRAFKKPAAIQRK